MTNREYFALLLDLGFDPDERQRVDLEPAAYTWGQPLRHCAGMWRNPAGLPRDSRAVRRSLDQVYAAGSRSARSRWSRWKEFRAAMRVFPVGHISPRVKAAPVAVKGLPRVSSVSRGSSSRSGFPVVERPSVGSLRPRASKKLVIAAILCVALPESTCATPSAPPHIKQRCSNRNSIVMWAPRSSTQVAVDCSRNGGAEWSGVMPFRESALPSEFRCLFRKTTQYVRLVPGTETPG